MRPSSARLWLKPPPPKLGRRATAALGACLALALPLGACAEGAGAAPPASAAVAPTLPHHPVTGAPRDYDPLLAALGDARFVLLGENTHGTSEFYLERARITERMVADRGALAVAIEADWPEAERLSRYVRGVGPERTAAEAMAGFDGFPRWMWRNQEFLGFIERLRTHNLARPPAGRVGVYGMDVQNLSGGQATALAWLARHDPPAAARARAQYRCFAAYRGDGGAYGMAARRPARSCEKAAAAVFAELKDRPRPADPEAAEALFAAQRAAASVVGAEAYFRAAYAGAYSWNVRDRHMTQTIEAIAAHAEALAGRSAPVVVWAHNSHVGDARSTDRADQGELNIGQLMRQRHGDGAFLVGFLTGSGTVLAAPEWGGRGRVYDLRPPLKESYAALLKEQGLSRALLLTRDTAVASALAGPRLQRAVGVVYARETERQSHYFKARMARQFDAVIYLEQTRAVTPLP